MLAATLCRFLRPQLFCCITLPSLGIVRSLLFRCLDSRTEQQPIVPFQDKFQNLGILWLCPKVTSKLSKRRTSAWCTLYTHHTDIYQMCKYPWGDSNSHNLVSETSMYTSSITRASIKGSARRRAKGAAKAKAYKGGQAWCTPCTHHTGKSNLGHNKYTACLYRRCYS